MLTFVGHAYIAWISIYVYRVTPTPPSVRGLTCCWVHITAEVLRHYLAAACDSLDAAGRVARRGDELLRKRCAVDSPKPVVDLEDPALVRVGTGAGAWSSARVIGSVL